MRLRRALPAGLVALAVAPAQAHLVETGFGAFYDGVAHVLLTPSDLLLVLAIGLLAGQRGTAAARAAVLLLPLAWLVGGWLGRGLPAAGAWTVATTLSFAVVGALVALNARLAPGAVAAFAVATGVLHGAVNGATTAGGGALALLGAAVAAFCVVTLLAGQVSALRAGWTQIAVRVGGSWIAASGVLMLGWLARG